MHSLFWLYLTINAPDFRLILLDRNTYEDIQILKDRNLKSLSLLQHFTTSHLLTTDFT